MKHLFFKTLNEHILKFNYNISNIKKIIPTSNLFEFLKF